MSSVVLRTLYCFSIITGFLPSKSEKEEHLQRPHSISFHIRPLKFCLLSILYTNPLKKRLNKDWQLNVLWLTVVKMQLSQLEAESSHEVVSVVDQRQQVAVVLPARQPPWCWLIRPVSGESAWLSLFLTSTSAGCQAMQVRSRSSRPTSSSSYCSAWCWVLVWLHRP